MRRCKADLVEAMSEENSPCRWRGRDGWRQAAFAPQLVGAGVGAKSECQVIGAFADELAEPSATSRVQIPVNTGYRGRDEFRHIEMDPRPHIRTRGIRFRFWAPTQKDVCLVLVGGSREFEMTRADDGYFEAFVEGLGARELYQFSLSGGAEFPTRHRASNPRA